MKETIKKILDQSILDINLMISNKENEIKTRTQILIGENGILDSLGYLNLMVCVENNIQNFIGVEFSFINYIDSDLKDNPFYSIESLEAFLNKNLNEK